MLFRSSVSVIVAASTVLENVVPPVCVSVITSNAAPLPTAPVILTVPVPVLNVKSLAVASLAILELNVTLALLVVIITSALNVTAPEYVCIPEVLTLAPKSETPDTVNDAAPAELSEVFCIIALRSNAPVIAIAPNGFVPPTTPLNLTVGVLDPAVIVKALARSEEHTSELQSH